ncbi:hypothetical protein O7606_25985 [Micromonospora sp. WMMD882]|uniref:hypothetical protein n=1 Tax=Micromonospora sp. WMMD882 TaxID=3015151 RepID=UPI00248C6FF7|nr:hypothetical protein [Micromonospora sp. WMMD882]WBB79558.1 hypothetical protein O7606_25985 [Micromonospora sp. WMMD882]
MRHREVLMSPDDGSPFFIAPHRFDATDTADQPVLDRRHAPVPEPGERVLARYRLALSGQLLDPAGDRRQWALGPAASVTVTDRRVVHVCDDLTLAPVDGDGPRHRRSLRPARPVSGQIRWQWPSRLELRAGDPSRPDELLIVCDSLRTLRQPALALGGLPARELGVLARLVRRSVAAFRLANPTLVELSAAERDVLLRRAGTAAVVRGVPVTLPGALPLEFLTRDDYYRPGGRPRRVTVRRPAAGGPGPAC